MNSYEKGRARKVLRSARDLVAQGWIRGYHRRKDDRCPEGYRYCAGGAIFEQQNRGFNSGDISCARSLFFRILPDGSRSIASWNDDKKRKKAEVLDAFERAMKL